MENFSNLLRSVETGHIRRDAEGLAEARAAVVEAARWYHTSRFSLGQAFHDYKACYLPGRGWMAAAKTIGEHLYCTEKTIRNIVADYLRLAQLPESIIAAADAEGLDLAHRRYASEVETLKVGLVGVGTPTLPEARQMLGRVLEPPGDAPKNALSKADRLHWELRLRIDRKSTRLNSSH